MAELSSCNSFSTKCWKYGGITSTETFVRNGVYGFVILGQYIKALLSSPYVNFI